MKAHSWGRSGKSASLAPKCPWRGTPRRSPPHRPPPDPGGPVVKQWITRHDSKVRTGHSDVDDQLRTVGACGGNTTVGTADQARAALRHPDAAPCPVCRPDRPLAAHTR